MKDLEKILNNRLELYSFLVIILSAVFFVLILYLISESYREFSYLSWLLVFLVFSLLFIFSVKLFNTNRDLDDLKMSD